MSRRTPRGRGPRAGRPEQQRRLQVQLTQQQAQLAQQVAPADRPRGGRRATLEIEGELTVHTAAEHRGPLLELLEPEGELALDLSAVTELDTAGLQLLLLAQREAHHLGGRLVVTGASRSVVDVLAIAHLDSSLRHLGGTTGSEAPR